jgi:glycosyltransferase involved in cell wall biosynthesis
LKKVSVIIPNYNQAPYLGCAIQSVLHQTFIEYEIIVVDDGSTDGSKDIVSAFGEKVRYIWQGNKGLGGARNTAILASKAEFIGLLDADDEWRPTYLEKMMAVAQRHPDAAVYFSGAQGMNSEGRDLPQIYGRVTSLDKMYQRLLRANFIIHSTVVFRRHVVVDAGLFEEKNRALHGCEDWDLWLRLSPSHRFVGTSEALVRYRLHSQTFSANPEHMQKAVKTVIEKNFGVDDGKYAEWSADKRRAFGGVYRYCALSSAQRQGDWSTATESLSKAFEIDPTLASDLDLFYELAWGSPPPACMDTSYGLNLERNAELVIGMLTDVFNRYPSLAALRGKSLATASYAIGLVANNLGSRDLSKRFIWRALAFSPKLLLERSVVFRLIKSLIDSSWMGKRKRFVQGGSHAG